MKGEQMQERYTNSCMNHLMKTAMKKTMQDTHNNNYSTTTKAHPMMKVHQSITTMRKSRPSQSLQPTKNKTRINQSIVPL